MFQNQICRACGIAYVEANVANMLRSAAELFFLIMMPSQNILKIPVFSFTFSFNAKKASSAIPDDEGISNRFTRGWKDHSSPSFG